ncbi:MAG TPA: hypothetical protein VKG25_20150 [Bryobacteraceae bacterium]|nr:hypothetical protein [Bryobacteraceae bacterium]
MKRGKSYDVQVGVPLPLICALLMPLAILFLPLALVGCLIAGVRIQRMLGNLFELLSSLRGTSVQVALKRHSLMVHIP